MAEQELVLLQTFLNDSEAHIVKTYLEHHDITIFIHGEYSNYLPWLSVDAGGGTNLMVFEKDLEKAQALILEKQT